MSGNESYNYERIEEAIEYMREHFREQPSLDDLAAHVHLSPFHFQRMFTDWAGVSPKKFLQFLTIDYAKGLIRSKSKTLLEAAYEAGLSGSGRLHDLFIQVEGMTPGEYRNGGESLKINYSFAESPFGEILVASTTKGICYMAFVEDNAAFERLQQLFPNASFQQMLDRNQQNALFIFNQDWKQLDQIKLHLKGTDFQLKVWDSLLKIPFGALATYSDIAGNIEQPNAQRAVGSAIGQNPVAYLIPCHRVIQSTGQSGNYYWGPVRKSAIIGWEAAKMSPTG